MNNFDFYSPTYFAFGKNKETQVGHYVKRFGGSKVLIHYGGGSIIRSGLLNRVTASLEAEGLSYVLLGGVMPNPRDGLVYEGIEICKNENIDFILAVGGGSTIDSAKAIALGALYAGDFWDFFAIKTHRPQNALPIGTVLTIAAAGSEGPGITVITKEKGMLKRSSGGECLRPKFSILNPELTQTLPPYQTACGITDMMAHVFERYFTKTKNVDLTDRLCESLLLTIINETPKVMADPDDYDARANIMWAGTLAHNNLVGVGRTQDWNSHWMEHELSALYDCAHGAGLAVIMPAWMTYVMHHDVMRFAEVATRVWGCQMDFENPEITAKAGIEAFKRFLCSIGMPISFKELGAKEEDIPVLIEKLGIGDGVQNGFVNLDRTAVETIFTLAL